MKCLLLYDGKESQEHGMWRNLGGAFAASLLDELSGARYLLEGNVGVVSVLEPVEAPLASILKLLGKLRAFRCAADTAVALAPAIAGCIPLRRRIVRNGRAMFLFDRGRTWVWHPLKIPTPPPGICKSKWLLLKSPPVLVTWTTIFLPSISPELNVSS